MRYAIDRKVSVAMNMGNLRCIRTRSTWLLFLAMLISGMPALVNDAHAAASTTVAAGSIILYPGGVGNVPITVGNIQASSGLGAYDLTITFDPSVVVVLDVLGGSPPFDATPTWSFVTAGKVRLAQFIGAPQGPTAPIVIANLKVQAVGGAGSSSAIGVTVNDLYDVDENQIDATGVSGSVTITTPRSSSSISLSLDKSEVRMDETVTLSGAISPAHAATVTLAFTRPDTSIFTGTTSSGADGSYAYVLTCDMGGSWTVTASWAGDSDHQGASSSLLTFTVKKLESSLSLTVSPSIIRLGGEVQIEGSLMPVREGAMVKLEYRVQGGEWAPIAEARTDDNGGFLYVWDTTMTVPGGYEVRASWQGDPSYEAIVSVPSFFYVGEDSTLSLWLSSLSASVKSPIVVRGSIFPLHAYVDVAISIRAPDGTVFSQNVQTDAAGNYKMRFMPDTVGEWSFNASWLGDLDTFGNESHTTELMVMETGSSVSLQANTTRITIGDSIGFSGTVLPAQIGFNVTIVLTRPDSNLFTLETTPNSNGIFSVTYIPTQAGVWLAQVSYPGNLSFGGATSLEMPFLVDKLASTVSLLPDPPVPEKGDLVTFEGTLSPNNSKTPLSILMSDDSGRTWRSITTANISAGGEYAISWRADRIGTFMFKAEWQGDEEHYGCSSPTVTLNIQDETQRQSVALPNNGEAEVIWSTDSSTIRLAADAVNGKIEATVNGTIGSTGVANVFVPTELLDSYQKTMDDLVFAVDGTPVMPEIVKVNGGYLVTIRYSRNAKALSLYYLTHSLTLVVTDYQNEALAWANVSLDGPIRLSGTSNSSGLAYFSHLPRGSYTVRIYYGPLIGEKLVNVTDDTASPINTSFAKIGVEYAELQERYESLTAELNLVRTSTYLFVVAAMTFVILVSLAGKKTLQISSRTKSILKRTSSR